MSEAIVAVLLVASGLLALTGALGLVRLPDYFLRMHAPSLAYTLGSWAVTLASIVHFTAHDSTLSLHVWLVIIVLSITAPVTTVLLARAALFRGRQAGEPLPAPLEAAPADGADKDAKAPAPPA
ncbi:Na+/H+ antiporter subunit G [Ramlibacter terrae]|uniref:Na+/H+ antiporter subunit G n=1 Tax=Ramlibacter terrae TaxID=2732511 RepID=A0ABX6P6J4_9BURK|nr:Na+/H+ antiporter subunit G [Ramlibacter terrae]